jgi:hypothetical protein
MRVNLNIRTFQIISLIVMIVAGLFSYHAWTLTKNPEVVVEWTTASEIETAGFNLSRSESAQGPYHRINDHLIPANNDPLVGGAYSYKDSDVIAGTTYYYQLEDVDLGGSVTTHGPIEIKAERRGVLELGLSFLLALIGIAWMVVLRRMS